MRAKYEGLVASGLAVCWRCGRSIGSLEPWDLGHVDGDPSRYAGPEHRACNRSTASRRETVVVPAGCFPRYGDGGEVAGWTSREW